MSLGLPLNIRLYALRLGWDIVDWRFNLVRPPLKIPVHRRHNKSMPGYTIRRHGKEVAPRIRWDSYSYRKIERR